MADAPTSGTAGTPDDQSTGTPILVDLGKRRRKQIRRLRKGGGKLMDEVTVAIREIQKTGRLSPQAQPVIVIVREKTKGRKFGMPQFC